MYIGHEKSILRLMCVEGTAFIFGESLSINQVMCLSVNKAVGIIGDISPCALVSCDVEALRKKQNKIVFP